MANDTELELLKLKAQARARAKQKSEGSDKGALGTSFAQSTFNSTIGSAGPIASTLLAAGASAPYLLPGGKGPVEAFREEKQRFPANALESTRFTIDDASAFFRSVPKLWPGGESFGDSFSRLQEEFAAESEQMREDHPIATAVGDVGGDIAGLAIARQPGVGTIRRFEDFVSKAPIYTANPGKVSNLFDLVLNNGIVRKFGRGLFRAGETGLDAMILETVSGEDDFSSVATAAGSQLVASAGLEVAKDLVGANAKVIAEGAETAAKIKLPITWRVGLGAAGVGTALLVYRQLTPSEGDDSPIQAEEDIHEKIAFGLALGVLTGLSGMGRLRGTAVDEAAPHLTDFINTIPRGFFLNAVDAITTAKPEVQQGIEQTLTALTQNPQAFSEEQLKELDAAKTGEEFANKLEEIWKDEAFQEQLRGR